MHPPFSAFFSHTPYMYIYLSSPPRRRRKHGTLIWRRKEDAYINALPERHQSCLAWWTGLYYHVWEKPVPAMPPPACLSLYSKTGSLCHACHLTNYLPMPVSHTLSSLPLPLSIKEKEKPSIEKEGKSMEKGKGRKRRSDIWHGGMAFGMFLPFLLSVSLPKNRAGILGGTWTPLGKCFS